MGIHFAGADKIIYFPIFLGFIFLVIRNYMRIKRVSQKLVHPDTSKYVFKYFSLSKQFVKALCLVTSILLLFFALLQPQWGKKEQKVVQEGRDVLLVLDVSRSMLAQDFKPTRLDFAKLKVRNLLSKMPFERVGLILFSGTAFLQCPLTADHAAFLTFLDHVDAQVISSGTTAIDKALLESVRVFGSSKGRKNKLVVLITDGEDFSINLDHVKQQLVEQGVTLFALGIGSEQGAPVPKLDSAGRNIGHEKDASGKIVLSMLNEKLLQETCQKLRGSYVRVTYDDADLDTLARMINKFEKERFDDKQLSIYEDQYPWLLGAAWFLLALEWIL